MAIKSGIKTTEFWLSLAAQVLGGLMATGAIPSAHQLPLLLVLSLGVGGCAFLKAMPWDDIIKAGGILVDAAGKATPYTCKKMEEMSAGAEHLARCYKADSIIKEKVGPGYGIGVGLAGTFATAAPLEVPGLGPVLVMALSVGAKPVDLTGQPAVKCIGFKCPTTAKGGVKVVDSPPVQ